MLRDASLVILFEIYVYYFSVGGAVFPNKATRVIFYSLHLHWLSVLRRGGKEQKKMTFVYYYIDSVYERWTITVNS